MSDDVKKDDVKKDEKDEKKVDAPVEKEKKAPAPKAVQRHSRKLEENSYVILLTGKYFGQLARINYIDEPAETVKVSVETGGEPFDLPWPDGVRAATEDEIPDPTSLPE